jgi:hypothetical protein
MPEISTFFGIIIRMFAEVGAPHHRPHFHALYQDALATFAVDPIECIGGQLPRTQQRLVEGRDPSRGAIEGLGAVAVWAASVED